MTTNYFQGKWAILDTTKNNYLSGNSGGLAALSNSITPSATFILYANSPEPGFMGIFMGYVVLQGNMQFIGVGNCSAGGFDGPGMCQLVPNAADPGSALILSWGCAPPLQTFINATDSNGIIVGNQQGIGIVNWDGTAFFGFYTTGNNNSFDPTAATVITPGLYLLSQSQSFPNSDFSFVDLTGQDFSGGYQFQDCNFQQSVLDQVNLAGANLSGCNFSSASLNGTNFTGATLSSSNFTSCDLTTIVYDDTTVVAATQSAPGSFNSARLPFTLINRLWQWLDLRNSTVIGIPSPLSSSAAVLQASGAQLSGMNQSFTGITLENAVLDNSLLDGLDMSNADLTSASLIDASMHGTNLSGATLVSVNMSGAQLGALSQLFTLPLSVETALNTGQVSALTSYFSQNGITLSSSATLETLATNRVWELDDVGNSIVYSIRVETQSGGTQVLNVYSPAEAASLANAYMPNAVLTGANLYGVLANNIQFYGSSALIDGSAVLEEAQLNGSNLSSVNFTQAQLLGTNLSGSYLFNAQFNGANLTPSANGIATNLSDANLQGAVFTDAQVFGTNMENAAVAINTPTQANPNQGGVYLFSLPYSGDTNTMLQYIAELNAAATLFSLNPNGDAPTLQKYVTALETDNLATLRIPFLQQSPPINLSNNAQIQTIEGGSVWQIVNGPGTYTLWTDLDENGETELYAAPSLTVTQAAFQQNDITLRWQASVSVDTADQQWLLNNDSENPQNFSTGYMNFLLVVNGTVLDVYGTALRIIRLGSNNQQEYDTETCNVTVLSVTNMNGSTICPNGATLSANQTQTGETWDQRWLRASALPKPPTCVPTDFNWCPTTSSGPVSVDSLNAGKLGNPER